MTAPDQPADRAAVVLHDSTVDRLLAGDLADDAVADGYEGVAELVRVLHHPPAGGELSGMGTAVAALVSGTAPAEVAPEVIPRPAWSRPADGPAWTPRAATPLRVASVTGGQDRRRTGITAAAIALVAAAAVAVGSWSVARNGGTRLDSRTPSTLAAASHGSEAVLAPTTTVVPTTIPAPTTTAPATVPSPRPQASAPAPPTSVPATLTQAQEMCAVLDRLPADLRALLDQIARSIGLSSGVQLCQAMVASRPAPMTTPAASAGGTGRPASSR